jgi:hypothetical protein
MKKVIIGLVFIMVMASASLACAERPTATFDKDTCELSIDAMDNNLKEWIVCIVDDLYIGINHESEKILCGVRIELKHRHSHTVDLSEYVDCESAVGDDDLSFGTIKSWYR